MKCFMTSRHWKSMLNRILHKGCVNVYVHKCVCMVCVFRSHCTKHVTSHCQLRM